MTWDKIEANWSDYKDDAKRTWPKLQAAELEVVGGERAKLVDKVRDAQGVSHEDAEKQVDTWAENL